MTSIASKYPVRSRFNQGRSPTATVPNNLNEKSFQIMTQKKKALRNLTESFINAVASCTRSKKRGKLLTATKLAEKELGQQTIQFLSLSTHFTKVQTTHKQHIKSTKEPIANLIEININVTFSSSL